MRHDSFPVRAPRVALRVIDGEAVLFNAEKGKVYALNPVGAEIWLMADGRKSIREIARKLGQKYEAETELAVPDVEEFAEGLARKGLFELREGPVASA